MNYTSPAVDAVQYLARRLNGTEIYTFINGGITCVFGADPAGAL
jgi:hypothetical protein